MTGVGTYTFNLINELTRQIPHENLFLIDYCQQRQYSELNYIFIAPWVKHLPKKSYIWHLYSQLELKYNHFDIDIIHSPENDTLPIKLENQKKIITVHDIRQQIYPEMNRGTIQSHLLLPNNLKTSDKIITVSNSTKNDLIKHLNVPSEKISVIYEAADPIYCPLSLEVVDRFKHNNEITGPYIMYVGNFAKHKNIVTLLNAFYNLKKRNIPHKLVLIGMKRWEYTKLMNIIQAYNLESTVILPGYIAKSEMPILYSGADLFVYPSLYEGFGLPPLEAMACGCPVITSNTSSLPEVVGDAGIMVDPLNVQELANRMYDVLTDDGLQQEMRRKGLDRAKLFSWKKCAKETLQVYEQCLEC